MEDCKCGTTKDADHTIAGMPVCEDCYDYAITALKEYQKLCETDALDIPQAAELGGRYATHIS